MSFFNKLASKLDELNLGGSEKPREREGYPSKLGSFYLFLILH